MKYRKKPMEVEARKVTADNAQGLAEWCGGEAYQRYFFGEPQTMVVEVPYNGVAVEATEGQWIVQNENGTFDAYPAHLFHAIYEPVI